MKGGKSTAVRWALFAEEYRLRLLGCVCERYIMLHFTEADGDPLLLQVCAALLVKHAHATVSLLP